MLYMMGRDDVAVGVGGEGGILKDGTILPNVGGYLPIIEQVYVKLVNFMVQYFPREYTNGTPAKKAFNVSSKFSL